MTPFKYFSSKRFSSYGLAVLLSTAAFVLARWLTPLLQNAPFDLFQAAIVLCAVFGGLGPALLTTVLSIVALDYFFLPPYNAFGLAMADALQLVTFGAVALLTSTLSARLKQAKSELERAHDELEQRIEIRTQELSRTNTALTEEVRQRLEAQQAILEISSREQQRLGQDLHDGLCQIVAGAKLITENIKDRLASRDNPEAQGMQLVASRLGEALSQADMISRGLYPVELETNGLMSALEELGGMISRIYSVTCRFLCPHPVFIHDSSVANHLYRMAQEAVMNAVKGGKADRITVRLRSCKNWVVLHIADNGIGFNSQPRLKGMGLKIMTYRARMINAELDFLARPRGGVLVRCSFEQHVP